MRKRSLRVSRIIRICACGCQQTFICKITEKKKFIFGHQNKGKNNPRFGVHLSRTTKQKIGAKRKGKRTLNRDRHENILLVCHGCGKSKYISYKDRRHKYCSRKCVYEAQKIKTEIRFCACGCGVSFVCKINARKKVIDGHQTRNKHLSEAHKEKLRITSSRNEGIKKRLRAVCKRPNKFEVRALNYLNTIYNKKFKYTGNGSFVVNHRSADAYSKELNTIALFHGTYWHLKRYGLEITEKNKRSVEKIDSLPFISAGFKVIFIWEDELNNLMEKIYAHSSFKS